MQFDWVTFALQLVNVLVLLAILRHFLFRPVAAMIAARQAETQSLLAEAETAKAEADSAAKAARAEVEANATARQKVLTDAQAEAAMERKRLLDAAHAEADTVLKAATLAATQASAEAEAATLTRARDLAQTIAERAVLALPDPPTVAGFATRLAAALAAMPEADRRSLLASGNLRLIAPHALTKAELTQAAATLGLEGLTTAADPALIAGLDLRSDNGVVHNSLAHDLTRIADALKAGGALTQGGGQNG